MDTFQTFDVDARPGWLKLIVAFEELVGISMITASVSWLVLVYPALERTRFLAKKTFVLLRAMKTGRISDVSSDALLREMADRVIQGRIDLILFPILLNFYAADRTQTLALALPHLQELASRSQESQMGELRLAAAELQEALADFVQMLADRVLRMDRATPRLSSESSRRAEVMQKLAFAELLCRALVREQVGVMEVR